MPAPRRTGSFVISVALALAGLAVAPASAAPCDTCGDGGGGGTTYVHTAQLTVVSGPHAITSDVVNGHAISCGAACIVSDSQTSADPSWPADGWWTYTLRVAGPAGYTARWFTCASTDGTTCSGAETQACATVANDGSCAVVNDLEGKRVRVSVADETPPSTPSISAPPVVGPSVRHVTASASDGAGVTSYRWYLDGVDQGLSPTGYDVPVSTLSEGAHTVSARARDGAGNESSLSAAATVVVDRSVHAAVSAVPDFVPAAPEVTFSTGDSDGVTFSCSVDAGSFAACASPWSPALTEGSHTLVVRATDNVGNTVTATSSFVVDATAPELSLTDGPAEGASIGQASTSVTPQQVEEHPDTFVCTIDAEPVACTAGSPVTLTDLGVGAHAFAVTATDRAGNAATLVRHFSRLAPPRQLPTMAMTAPSRAAAGRRVTLRVSLTGTAGQVTGPVTWKVGRKVVCRTTLSGGRSTCRTPKLRPGRQVVVATYAGSASYTATTVRRTIRVRR